MTACAVEKQHWGKGRRRVRVVDGSRHKEQERNHNKDTFLLCLRDKKRPVGSSAAEGGGGVKR